ncbi:MAG: hypothetical protein RI947_944 [Candidatus Parcubacteria bacterium]
MNPNTKSSFHLRFNKYWYAGLLIAFLLLAGAIRDFSNSMFFHKQNRINVLFYSSNTRYYSFGIDDTVNYNMSFFPDLKMRVLGGYGYYRIGALGKLIHLEHNPYIFKKAFSYATASFVDYYFYPDSDEIYYGMKELDPNITPKLTEIFFQKSNASFFDRLYLFFMFSRLNPEQYKTLRGIPYEKKGDDVVFLENDFKKSNGGYFYDKKFREEKKEVQVIYSEYYGNASAVSNILEGSGIRVSDISEAEKPEKHCVVKEQAEVFSETAKELARFFQCSLEKGSSDIYDIIFILGDREKEWASK